MIQLNADTAARLNQGVQAGNSIELPFFSPVFWVVNGDPRLKNAGGAAYYGGWAVSAEDWQKALEEWGINEEDAPVCARTELVTADGKTMDCYTTRSLVVAPICTRTTWIVSKEGGQTSRSSVYQPGARQNVQAIVYLAVKKDGKFVPLGTAMLTAKGYQAKNLLDAFQAWNRSTSKIRGQIAKGIPAWTFYLAIGTFGEKRAQVMVGQSSQSPITPIGAYIPKEITEPVMESLFVGSQHAEAMAVYLDSSVEWLHAYDNKTQNSGAVPVETPVHTHYDDGIADMDSLPPDYNPPF